MKKIILLSISSLFICISAVKAQSLAGYKFCINPGHRGYNPAYDRFISETGFWESEGNLKKALNLRDILESLGATVIMTRTTQVASEQPESLSQIVEIANSYNVDYFHSIHSNATGTSTKVNYTLILFQGRTSVPTYPGSLVMANLLAEEIFKAHRTTKKMVAGDFDFYGTGQPYLGVFKGLTMPGTLSEGSFHDYYPESWRLKNDSYLKHEAWAIARAFLQYYNKPGFSNGIVAGILRDISKTVPSSYNPITGTNDNYKPLNKIKVSLEPGSKIYNGDEFNNGFYFFDNLTPGNYKLILEADKFLKDSANVVVSANQSTFYDKLMDLQPILDPPKLISYSPTDSLNEVSNILSIVFEFDIRMNATETQNAFSITPTASGNFKWENDFKKLIFTPTKGYTPGAKHIVKISNTAKSFWGVNLQQNIIFSFTTRSKLNLVSTYPANGANDISTTLQLNITFDRGIDGTDLGGKISFTDSLGNSIPVNVNQSKYNIGIIEFEPKTPLNNKTLYRLLLKEGIRDIEYVTFKENVTIEFRTESLYMFTGNILDPFEQDFTWNSPASSPNTVEVNTSITRFDIMTEKFKGGDRSGRLEYQFTGINGNIEVVRSTPIPLGDQLNNSVGMWVFGDNSKNILEYKFTRQSSGDHKVKIDTINWTGWKMKKIPFSQIPGSGSIQFKSINIVQNPLGNKSGKLFFDELTSNIITDVSDEFDLPSSFTLEQNYPNPFNPTTTIQFVIPGKISNLKNLSPTLALQNENFWVTLKVYDITGCEVTTLIDEIKSPGVHKVVFDGSNLASGVYIYRIQIEDQNAKQIFFNSKKLILLK
jgi:N-acetylmuramoyl-L-alanine amidase